jgi:hypothetical protein
MTKRKFYKTRIIVEVLSEEPVNFDDLSQVHYAITNGDCSGRWEETDIKELNGKEAVMELGIQGSSPEWFGLTDDGEDME